MAEYKNMFSLIGKSDAEVKERLNQLFQTIFFDEEERFYFDTPCGTMGYMLDTGNIDARTEGMSYGMMMTVQMDRKDLFDKLWLFTVTHMLQRDGKYQGYFAWSVNRDGSHRAEGPAPDGEEYFAMALFFASARWGDGEAPYDYSVQAREILRHCVHQDEIVPGGDPMWNRENHYIKFIPESPYSDPSYHLPHFYQLFADRANAEDRAFWAKAAQASREYIALSSHPATGMSPEYAEYDGSPRHMFRKSMDYYSDAYRVVMNIALDHLWMGETEKLDTVAENLQKFFYENTEFGVYGSYMLDGTVHPEPAMHPVAITATLAAGSIASEGPYKKEWLQRLWDTPLRKGVRRYYDNCLYFFSFLMLSGEYKIY
ncbi:MAG: xylanase [Clostridia bacterium]|nr:xylanase [Clostridia bacterium]